jgi:hypothetical protein
MRYITSLRASRHDLDAYKEAIENATIEELKTECLELATKLKQLSDAEKINIANREFLHMWFD